MDVSHRAVRVIAVAAVCCSATQAQPYEFAVGPLQKSVKQPLSSARTEAPRRLSARAVGEPGKMWLAALSAEEHRQKTTASGNRIVGRVREIAEQQMAIGRWDSLSDARRFWRMSIVSPGAAGLRLHFTDFDVGSGRVLVYSSDASEAEDQEPYTARGLLDSGEFWSAMIPGDTVVVEYEPDSADADPEVRFRIDAVGHIGSTQQTTARGVRAMGGVTNNSEEDDVLPCHVHVACAPDQWRQMGQAVAMLLGFEGKHLIACSGTLLNNYRADFRPYFLTANHCISDPDKARTAMVLWQYELTSCGGEAPDLRKVPQQRVERLLVTKPTEDGDVSLLLLAGNPPPKALFSGWTSKELPMGGTAAGIHHPGGTEKRYSIGSRMGDHASRVLDETGKELARAPADRYYRIQWLTGATETGSSGSGLFDEHSRLVGVLSHGSEGCGGRGLAGYGRFSEVFPHLQRYLVDGEQ